MFDSHLGMSNVHLLSGWCSPYPWYTPEHKKSMVGNLKTKPVLDKEILVVDFFGNHYVQLPCQNV